MYAFLESSFILIQFFVLNLDSWFDVFPNQFIYLFIYLFIFDIPLLYCINLNSLIVCYLFSRSIYFSFSISVSFSSIFKVFCEVFEWYSFETFVILSAVLLPIISLVASADFWIALFEAVFIASVVDFLVLSRSVQLYLLFKVLPIFSANDKKP